MPNENEPGSLIPGTETETTVTPQAPAQDVNQIVNAAVTAHLKRFAEKTLPTLLQGALAPITEQLKTAQAAPKTEEAPAANKPDPQLAAMNAKIAELTKALSDGEAKRVAIETKAREDRAFAELKSNLAGQVRPELVDMLANNLFHMDKLVEIGDDGAITFKGKRELTPGFVEDVSYPLKAGVEQWLKSEQAKVFLPAPQGSQAPTVSRGRPVVQANQFGKDADTSKMSDDQKLAYADQQAAQLEALLKSRQ